MREIYRFIIYIFGFSFDKLCSFNPKYLHDTLQINLVNNYINCYNASGESLLGKNQRQSTAFFQLSHYFVSLNIFSYVCVDAAFILRHQTNIAFTTDEIVIILLCKQKESVYYLELFISDVEIKVHYQTWCNKVICEGAEILGISLGCTVQSDTSCLLWSEMKFQPYCEDVNTVSIH